MTLYTANELTTRAFEHAQRMVADNGGLVPMVYLHLKDELHGVPYLKDTPQEAASRAFLVSAIREARRGGIFQGAVMLSEAWGVTRTVGDDLDIRPAEQADRRELLVIVAFGGDGSKRGSAWQMLREDRLLRLGPSPEFDSNDTGYIGGGWIDEAFADQQGVA
jgi:hypothetical protein